jgi:hypothetical protein
MSTQAQTIIVTQFSGTAAASAAAAEDSKVAAQLAETNAETAETNAEAAEVLSEKWAENPEDVAVETGKYSAKHHALKASASKIAAETAETNAETAQGLAETAKTAAQSAKLAAEAAQLAAENLYGDLAAVSAAKTAAETAETNAETAQGLAETAKTAAQAAQLAAEIAAASSGTAGSEADAIQLLCLHNPDLVFSGFVNTSTSTPSHTANKAYINTTTGTVFGIANVPKGAIINDTGSTFVVEPVTNNDLNSIKYQLLRDNLIINLTNKTISYAHAISTETGAFIGDFEETDTAIQLAVSQDIYDKIAFWSQTSDFGRNFPIPVVVVLDETDTYIAAVEEEENGVVGSEAESRVIINNAIAEGIYSDIALLTHKTYLGRNFTITDVAYILSLNKYLLKVSGDDILLVDSLKQDDVLTINAPISKEVGSASYAITKTSETVTEGYAVGDWLGYGTVISRIFEDTKRKITQIISSDSYSVKIKSTIEIKEDVSVEEEGFIFSGIMWLDKHSNIQASGTGQNIINQRGIFFHDGSEMPHMVLADLMTSFMYREFVTGETEEIVLSIVDNDKYVPVRILTQPDGYNSAFTISNHADDASIERQRAVHFGTSDVDSKEYGKKGISGRDIKADWSVWAGGNTLPNQPGFSTNTEYAAFLAELKAKGTEIIPHNVKAGTVTRADAEGLIPLYDSSNWTDHGLGAGSLNLGIASRGWDSEHATYFLDLLEEAGINKAWSYQDFYKDRITNNALGFPHNVAYFNDHLKMPSGERILLWKSSLQPFYDRWLNLDDLVDNCGSVDAHDYIAFTSRESLTGNTSDFRYTHYLDGSVYKITDGFDGILAQIQAKQKSGEIWNPSNTEFHDYFKALKKVHVEIVSPTEIKLTNSGNHINGFSMLIYKNRITPTLNNIKMFTKAVKSGTICWGSLKSGINTINL